jgi:hypothetical protein
VIYGIDANFLDDIEKHSKFFNELDSYLNNGVAFWETYAQYGIHHPFLLYKAPPAVFLPQDYPLKKNRGGVPYHKHIGGLNLPRNCARCVSFVELLNIPTMGSTEEDRFWGLFEQYQAGKHAKEIENNIRSNSPKLILLSNTVIDKMLEAKNRYKDIDIFGWVHERTKRISSNNFRPTKLSPWKDKEGHEICELYKIRHFSSLVYLKEEEKTEVLKNIRELILSFCETNFHCYKLAGIAED